MEFILNLKEPYKFQISQVSLCQKPLSLNQMKTMLIDSLKFKLDKYFDVKKILIIKYKIDYQSLNFINNDP